MSTFYEENLIIYGMSFNSFIPYSVKDDILSKIRKNFLNITRDNPIKLFRISMILQLNIHTILKRINL